MKVKCKTKSYKILSEDYLKDIFTVPEDFPLIEDKVYVVYGVMFKEGMTNYLINDESCDDSFPMWNPAPLFEVIENKLSTFWVYKRQIYNDRIGRSFIIFSEWAESSSFYTNLVDGEEKEKKIWLSVKKKLDLEFEN